MKRRGSIGITDLISTLTMAVLFIVILLLVVFAAASYQSATERQNANDRDRAVLSYITTAVRGSGRSEVEPAEFGGAPGLAIREKETGYEQRIYLSGGKLLQEYERSDADIDPEHALVIGETKELSVDYVTDDVLKITTDLGTSYVHVDR